MLSIAEWSTWSLSILTRAELTLPSLVSFSIQIKLRMADSRDLSCLPMKEERVLKLSVLEGCNSVENVSGVWRWWESACLESVLLGETTAPPSWEWEPDLDSLEWKPVLGRVEWEPVLGKVELESVLDKVEWEPSLIGGLCWVGRASKSAGTVDGWSTLFGFLPTFTLLWGRIETVHNRNSSHITTHVHVHVYHISGLF